MSDLSSVAPIPREERVAQARAALEPVAADAAALGVFDKTMCGHGHFCAARLLEVMGISAETGVLRLSLVHYTSDAEVQQLIGALERTL